MPLNIHNQRRDLPIPSLLKPNAMQQEKQEPILIIDRPDGSQLRLYQELSDNYAKKLIEEFMNQEGTIIRKPGIKNKPKI